MTTESATLADEIERLVDRATAPQDTRIWGTDVGVFVIDNAAAILSALRTPAPAGDAVERAKLGAHQRTVDMIKGYRMEVWGTIGKGAGKVFDHILELERRLVAFQEEARAALAALPAPQPALLVNGEDTEELLSTAQWLVKEHALHGAAERITKAAYEIRRLRGLLELPAPQPEEAQRRPCGRNGCGETRACCREDCPIEMISAEPNSGLWVWRKNRAQEPTAGERGDG